MTTAKTIAQIYYASGSVRYHTHPIMIRLGQTNADHQARATKLLMAMHRALGRTPPTHLVEMVLHHDVAEHWAGDVPFPFKADNPELAKEHAAFETRKLRALGFGPTIDAMSGWDWHWLELVDKLEAYLFMLTHRPQDRTQRGWHLTVTHARRRAEALGVDVQRLTDRIIHEVGVCQPHEPGEVDVSNPNPRFVVDGHTYDDPDSDLASDGEFAPFYVFDTERQKNVEGPFETRGEAEAAAYRRYCYRMAG
jgi:hypothetical protein